MIDTRLLRAFRAVAEELHFGRAAERLHMSQPPLSLAIRQLEELLGATLFTRTTRKVQLTAAGEELLRHIRKMEQIHVEATTAIRQLASGMTGELTIALTPSAAYSPVTVVLQSFRARHPDVHLRLREMNSRDMADALLGGHVDAALARPFKFSSALTSQTVYVEPLYLSVPRGHTLATKPTVTVEDLVTADLIGYCPNDSKYFHELLTRLFHSARLRIPDSCSSLTSIIPTILLLVESGVGTAVVPHSLTRLRRDRLCYIPIAAPRTLRAQLIAVTRIGDPNPALKRMLDLLLLPNESSDVSKN